ncbi:nucleoside-diphosphate kinase [candidate division KSB1 bacterium]|nr:nucleoside-diphosphate kinase [candidate division KSB1 bacterium]NIR71849.1 nucleoside-diphosphate kinase [candidate division KSB1 bacterium]NIS25365.1 nucleoside-diphosphate kinase [candidate division KSB1 bacterium]NIT71835.1 nucleoside-diphosphate kinase [candidate division KSB1 bacterium]NIU25573.1 nucleoside-diphosphate kinase [candidate division KSB1 bacterium]
MERTLAILKPDCVGRNLIGKVIDRIEREGFKILAMKMVRLTEQTTGEFYAVHRKRPFYRDLVQFMSSGHAIPMVLAKENAVNDFRKLIGATDPAEAESGTIRHEFAENKQNNIVHGSDSVRTAKSEIAFYFSEKELVENNPDLS